MMYFMLSMLEDHNIDSNDKRHRILKQKRQAYQPGVGCYLECNYL